jgi:hypothetical protein
VKVNVKAKMRTVYIRQKCNKNKNGNEKMYKSKIESSEKNCEELRMPSPCLGVNEYKGRRFLEVAGVGIWG